MNLITAQTKFQQVALKYGFSLFGLPKTGQITTVRTGDDGYYQKGYPRTGARFFDNGDGTITDNATGLMWVKSPAVGLKTWNNAIDYCEALNFAGYSDWRTPNIFELLSIHDRGKSNPAIDTNFFVIAGMAKYWSSTKNHASPDYRWVVQSFDGGETNQEYTEDAYIRPVRLGGQT